MTLPLMPAPKPTKKYSFRVKQLMKEDQYRSAIKKEFNKVKSRSTGKTKVKTRTIQSIAQLKASVQRVVNAYVRKRDADDPCISCQKRCESGEAGHFIAQGASGYLRYNLDNLRKQCGSCNRWKHGNLLEYRIHLVEKIGKDRVEWMENNRNIVKKWTREELEEIRQRIKSL